METEVMAMVISTETGLKEFLDGNVWKDMKSQLGEWEAGVRREYDHAEDMQEIGKIRGRIEALNYFMLLPEVLLEGIIEARLEKERERAQRAGEEEPEGTDDME